MNSPKKSLVRSGWVWLAVLGLFLSFDIKAQHQKPQPPPVPPGDERLEVANQFFQVLLDQRDPEETITFFHSKAFQYKHALIGIPGNYLEGEPADDPLVAKKAIFKLLKEISDGSIGASGVDRFNPEVIEPEDMKSLPKGVKLLSDPVRDGFGLLECGPKALRGFWDEEANDFHQFFSSEKYLPGMALILVKGDEPSEKTTIPLVVVFGREQDQWKIVWLGFIGN